MKKIYLFILLLAVSFSAFGTDYNLSATINAAQQVPTNTSSETGSMSGTYNDVSNQLSYTITYSMLQTSITAMHFHGDAAAGSNNGIKLNISTSASPISATATLTETDEMGVLNGLWYINIHTSTFSGGDEETATKRGAEKRTKSGRFPKFIPGCC